MAWLKSRCLSSKPATTLIVSSDCTGKNPIGSGVNTDASCVPFNPNGKTTRLRSPSKSANKSLYERQPNQGISSSPHSFLRKKIGVVAGTGTGRAISYLGGFIGLSLCFRGYVVLFGIASDKTRNVFGVLSLIYGFLLLLLCIPMGFG